jgi:GT2 family glycosyltransferase
MKLSVVVPTWRRPAELSRCLEGLAGQSRAPDEVVVVAREEDEKTWALLREPRPDGLPLRPARVERPGVLEALRTGIEAVEGDVVAITDDDSIPRPDWIERMETALAGDERVGGVGGRDFVHQDGRVVEDGAPAVGRVRWYGRVLGNHHLGSGPPREVDVLKGVNVAFRRVAIADAQLPRDLRGSGAQVHWELDLCLAVKNAGWKLVYDPRIAVDHFPAHRYDEDRRRGRPLAALGNEVFNLTLVLLRRLPPGRAAVAFGYGVLVGTRDAPGLVTACERALRGRHARGALGACERARTEALREHLRTRGR